MTDDQKRLKPARPDVDLDEKPAYMPRVPWRYLVLGAVAATVLVGFYVLREDTRASELRAQILTTYRGELGPFGDRYRAFRDELEGYVREAASQERPRDFADPRLRISALHQGRGLYLRLSRRQARTPDGIAAAAKDLLRDGIGRCLGISPTSVRGFYESGQFLMPGWIDEVETASVARLEVLRDDLARRMDRDVPGLATAMQAEYFLLVLQQAQSRRDDPSDVFLWDLRANELLLSVRTEPIGRLVPVRIALPGVEVPRRQSTLTDSVLADDCAIAAQVKAIAGEPAMGWESELPAPGAGTGAGTGDAEPDARTTAEPGAGTETGGGVEPGAGAGAGPGSGSE